MILRKLFLIYITVIGLSGVLNAQSGQYQKQITVISENDSYISVNYDGYYTNGAQLSYQWRKLSTDKSLSKINQFELGQFIYNAQDGQMPRNEIDRPITGYLFLNFQQSLINKRENIFKWKAELGTIGALSFGKQIQETIHDWWNIYPPRQWRYQMNSGWGFTGTASWHPELNPKKDRIRFGIKPFAEASLGNMFTNLKIGSGLLYGKFNTNGSTAFWNNHFSSSKNQKEYYLYIYPILQLQAYNATVQGNMFSNRPEIIEGKLNPVFLQSRAGFAYATSKYSLGFAAIYESKQSLTQRAREVYGSIQLGFRW